MRARFVNEVKEESEFSPKQKSLIKKFVLNYKGDFKDEDIHSFSEKIGLDKHEVEEYIYAIARQGLKSVNEENTIKGGKGDKLTEKDVCPKQLAVGKKVEREHTSSAEKATEIALDHLSENPKYYSELVKKGFVDEGPAIKEFVKQFGKKELPKRLQENVSFERGQDPKSQMGVGIKDYEGYVKVKLKEMFPDKDLDKVVSEFWEMFNDGFEDWKSYEFADSLLDVLKHTPLKYQMEYMEGDLEEFQDGVEEGYITI